MRHFLSTSEASQASPRAAAEMLREWLPALSGSVVVHGAAICCFVAATENGPQAWPVTRGRHSVASAPAIDSRAGTLLARIQNQMPPLRIEIADVPDASPAYAIRSDPLTVLEVARDVQHHATTEVIEHLVEHFVNARANIPVKAKASDDQPIILDVNPDNIRDQDLLRTIKPISVTTDAPAEEKSENGSSASQGNAVEDSAASSASAAANGAEDNQLPQPVASNVAPPYPEEARAAGLQGKVTLRLHISVDGRIESLKILTSSGVPSLDQSALAAVKQWRFEPARRQGRPVAMDVKTSISFQIEAE
jgi:TonB family protein